MLIYSIMGFEELFCSQTKVENSVPCHTKLSCENTKLSVENTQVSHLLKNNI